MLFLYSLLFTAAGRLNFQDLKFLLGTFLAPSKSKHFL